MVPSITFILNPLSMMTSPPRMPGLQGPIHVIVMCMSGRVLPSVVMSMAIFESKSPVTWARVVRTGPLPNEQFETEVQEPSKFRVAVLAVQFLRRVLALNTDILACDSSVTQDWVVIGLPIITMDDCQRPDFWCGGAWSARA